MRAEAFVGVGGASSRDMRRDCGPEFARCISIRDAMTPRRQPPAVHALARAMNERLGNIDKTVMHIAPVAAAPVDQLESISELT
jgi:hypothetical protein